MNRKLFNPLTRIQTRGIKYNLSKELINFIWGKIDELNSIKVIDYLQVFEFRVKKNTLVIEHRQEVPKFKKKYILSNFNNIHKYDYMKIFVIDDFDYSIMMLASEY